MSSKIYEVYYYEGQKKYSYAFFSTRVKADTFISLTREPFRLKDLVSTDKSNSLGVDKRHMYEWAGAPLHIQEWDLDEWDDVYTNEPLDK